MFKKISKNIVCATLALLLTSTFPVSVFADSGTVPQPAADSSASSSSAPASSTDSSPPPSTSSTSSTPTTNSSSYSPGNGPVVQPSAASPTSPSSTSPKGPSSPTGADSNTYTYNSTTGLWENAYYTWNPVTHQTQPKTPQNYSYNPATGMWDTTLWVFDAASHKYVPKTDSVAHITQTGPGSNNSINQSLNNNGYFNLFFNGSISNSTNMTAVSGDASVVGNTLGGNALSGNALNVSNVLNLLQSSINPQTASNILTFSSNINGNVTGDLLLDPSQITNTGPLSVNSSSSQTQNNLTVNSQSNGQINNNITLGSISGNATIASNTSAGNATSGNASSIADVVNMLNSAVNTGKSFLGVININGNLNGDILLPPNFLNQLITSTGPGSNTSSTQTVKNTVQANSSDTQTINNNINLAAMSGNASVDNNTTAGNATTGNASTKVTIMNLTGKQVIAANSLLVFVNVLGKWVGLIMNAPAGSTGAALCGGSCQTSNIVNNNATLNSTSNTAINNNINALAQSGNALVRDNTLAGNATSGSASASANILNISGSQLSLSNWFGVLFINVLGSWQGSFGINTDAGNVLGGLLGSSSVSGGTNPSAVFRFVPATSGGKNKLKLSYVASTLQNNPVSNQTTNNHGAAVLASSTNHTPTSGSITKKASGSSVNLLFPAIAAILVILAFVGVDSGGEIGDRIRVMLLQRKLDHQKVKSGSATR